MENKLNGFNNGRDTTDGVGGKDFPKGTYIAGVDPYQEILKTELHKAVKVLCNALREDTSEGSYYYSWQANIAMCMYDSFSGSEIELIGNKNLIDICNKGAKNFLDLLIKQ